MRQVYLKHSTVFCAQVAQLAQLAQLVGLVGLAARNPLTIAGQDDAQPRCHFLQIQSPS